jgi:hypothetical protein
MSIVKLDHDEDYPVPAHLVEPTDPAERTRLLDAARADIAAGHGIPHEQVAAWLFELAAGRPAKAPCDQ